MNRIIRCFVKRRDMSTGLLYNGYIDSRSSYVMTLTSVRVLCGVEYNEKKTNDYLLKGKCSGLF